MKTKYQTPAQVKVPGLLGMAVRTDSVYLQAVHQRANEARDLPVSSLNVALYGVNFALLIDHIRSESRQAAEDIIVEGMNALTKAGADFGVITSNTVSAVAEKAADRIKIPLLNIADVTCRTARQAGVSSLGLLSTIPTNDYGIYQRAGVRHEMSIISPSPEIAGAMDALIWGELVAGKVTEAGLDIVRNAVDWFKARGADGIALACTDITHMASTLAATTSIPLFDSTVLHGKAAADVALGTLKI